MRHDQQARAGFSKLPYPLIAFVYKVGIAHGQRLIDNEDVRPHGCGDTKATRICMPLEYVRSG